MEQTTIDQATQEMNETTYNDMWKTNIIWVKPWQQQMQADLLKSMKSESEDLQNSSNDLLNLDESKEPMILSSQQIETKEQLSNQGEEKQLNTIRQKLEDTWRSEQYLLSSLKRGFEEAVFQGPKGAIIEDRKTRVQIAKEVLKLMWHYKQTPQIVVVNQFQSNDRIY